ncbi:MAG: hypothetical protein KBF63_18980 [Rhodoferax sp.]|nr:hypothetical protein [Rhodoferax sp.]
MMQMNAVATVLRRVLKIDYPPSNVAACKRAANDGHTTHPLHFAYLPVMEKKAFAGATAELLDRWLQDRSDARAAARPLPALHDSPGVLRNADRFSLEHAASALKNLQSVNMAGRAVIHLSTSCLTDPLLPVYVISLLQRRGVRLDGVNVTLGAGRRCPSSAGSLPNAIQSPSFVGYRTDEDMVRRASSVDALLGRRGTA